MTAEKNKRKREFYVDTISGQISSTSLSCLSWPRGGGEMCLMGFMVNWAVCSTERSPCMHGK